MRLDSLRAENLSQTEIETICGERLSVRLVVNPRARRVSVRIDPTRREAIATAPSKRQLRHAVQFASERATWIARELARLPQGISLVPGALAPLRGQPHLLAFEHGRSAPRIVPGDPLRLVAPAPDLALFESRMLRYFKDQARGDLIQRVAAHAEVLGVTPRRIQVKELRSRWGSCSMDGVLSFAWRIILAPPPVLDYLAAHEVAHLCEMNHSRRFWAHVRRCVPEFEAARAWLHQHGSSLHAVGLAR